MQVLLLNFTRIFLWSIKKYVVGVFVTLTTSSWTCDGRANALVAHYENDEFIFWFLNFKKLVHLLPGQRSSESSWLSSFSRYSVMPSVTASNETWTAHSHKAVKFRRRKSCTWILQLNVHETNHWKWISEQNQFTIKYLFDFKKRKISVWNWQLYERDAVMQCSRGVA